MELGGARQRDLDVLDDALAGGPPAALVEPGHDLVPVLERDDLPVDVRAEPALGPQPPHQRLLGAERARAPEPVGVPPPQVVAHGEQVALALLQRAVEDLLTRVVAGAGAGAVGVLVERVGPPAEGQVRLVAEKTTPSRKSTGSPSKRRSRMIAAMASVTAVRSWKRTCRRATYGVHAARPRW